ncbi:BnaA06g15570D [Brassica napus]|uniref:(rape) hypothetical protein n=1 Tax=Brassica napus TaxID=3708 RepID=A0A078F539_BRANA|nr:unnamed protein product [Brassica napus]CDY08169.1 BnaA06g15570D [Brassica napus]
MLLRRTFGWAGFLILQSFTLKKYSAELSLTALICLMGTLEGTVVSLLTVPLGVVVLSESIHLGSVIGTIFIIAGL